jgi:hypothetical protein
MSAGSLADKAPPLVPVHPYLHQLSSFHRNIPK